MIHRLAEIVITANGPFYVNQDGSLVPQRRCKCGVQYVSSCPVDVHRKNFDLDRIDQYARFHRKGGQT